MGNGLRKCLEPTGKIAQVYCENNDKKPIFIPFSLQTLNVLQLKDIVH